MKVDFLPCREEAEAVRQAFLAILETDLAGGVLPAMAAAVPG